MCAAPECDRLRAASLLLGIPSSISTWAQNVRRGLSTAGRPWPDDGLLLGVMWECNRIDDRNVIKRFWAGLEPTLVAVNRMASGETVSE